MTHFISIGEIAEIAHEVNRAYCAAIGDHSQVSWSDAPQWQKDSAIDGVHFHINNPTADPASSHKNWLEKKRVEGWKYGPVKNVEAKEHPCFVEYDQLPEAQRAKDFLFRSVVHQVGRIGGFFDAAAAAAGGIK